MTPASGSDIDPVARALIRRKVPRLVGRFGFTRDDADDLAQELALHAHLASRRFDPARSAGFRFYDRVLTNKVRSLIAAARCQKRDRRRERSFDDHRVILDWDVADRLALAVDVADALEPLAPADREVANLLVTDGVAEVARWTGRARGTVRGAKARIARALAEKDLAVGKCAGRQPSRERTRYVLDEGVAKVRNSRPTGRKAKVVGVPPVPRVFDTSAGKGAP
jgi:DNA-directed RNA polymerase specialized sigma24 family protein